MFIMPDQINLLYIEDDESISDVVVQYLHISRHTKFNVIVKNTLEKGMGYLNDKHLDIDAILLDLVLPNSEGVNTFKLVNDKYGNIIPIVIISGFEDLACQCVKLGAQDYLLKPDMNSGLLIRSIKYAIERKKIEIKYKQAQEIIKLNEKKFRDLVEITKANIYEIDFINNRFIYVNDVMCKNLGYTRKELIEIEPKNILTDKGLREWVKRLILLSEGEYIDPTFEYEIIKKDGSTGWVLITAEFIEDENDNVIGANVVAIDITDKKLASDALEKKEDEVYATLETKIRDWRNEMLIRNVERDEQLKVINGEILSMTNGILEMSNE